MNELVFGVYLNIFVDACVVLVDTYIVYYWVGDNWLLLDIL